MKQRQDKILPRARTRFIQAIERLVKLYEQSLAEFSADPEAAKKMATEPLGAPPEGSNLAELAAWTVVSNVLLNLDETITKE